MDHDSANIDFSLSQHAYLHETVPAGDGTLILIKTLSQPIPTFICLHQGCELSFPTAKLLEAHAIIHANGKQTPNAIDDSSIVAGHWSPDRLHHGFGYIPSTIHTAPSGTFNDVPTGFCDPNHGWPNAFNPVGISGYDYTDPVRNMPTSTLTAIGEGDFTQGFHPSGIASHGPYDYGHSQPRIAAPPLTQAVDQMSDTFNDAGPVQTRPVCMQCGRDFRRQSDLDRHMKKHQPNAHVYQCQVQGCQYRSKRKDKVMEHSRRPH
ncbi:hypothetical protein JMJ35_004380 [Cladonia borealis]|uniref:C2H2-type domain-containing protein n=1 Tax=Cladonia borealis TaxID=184061 RepID=A0AA39R4A9_9LECA|nr:hypothetical protein JMJ35_004380 [Cladonia borealis]